jgi:hypothetical protein
MRVSRAFLPNVLASQQKIIVALSSAASTHSQIHMPSPLYAYRASKTALNMEWSCLAKDLEDLKTRLGNIIVAYTRDRKPVRAAELKAHGPMAVLLKDALSPNLVQTLEGTPAFIHGGPFANIAHGCNSVVATTTALKLADYVVTEAGFGADLGAEKFMDIKCRKAGIAPDCVVLVATIRALKRHGGLLKDAAPHVAKPPGDLAVIVVAARWGRRPCSITTARGCSPTANGDTGASANVPSPFPSNTVTVLDVEFAITRSAGCVA